MKARGVQPNLHCPQCALYIITNGNFMRLSVTFILYGEAAVWAPLGVLTSCSNGRKKHNIALVLVALHTFRIIIIIFRG